MTSSPSILTRARRRLFGGVGVATVATIAFAVAAAHNSADVGSQELTGTSTDTGSTTRNAPEPTQQYQGYDQSYGSDDTSQNDGSQDGSSGLSNGESGSADGSSHAS